VNVGMTDLVAALCRVRDNIANFGGDPDCVMIYGQSGGGSLWLLNPSAVGLPRSWPVPIETIGSGPAPFAGICAKLAGIKACPRHRMQAGMPASLMNFIDLPFL
jgi:hypothetical protein